MIKLCTVVTVPESARVKSYLVLERNGFIYIWYHAEGNEPDWEPEEIAEIASGEWAYGGRTEHIVSAHIEVNVIVLCTHIHTQIHTHKRPCIQTLK